MKFTTTTFLALFAAVAASTFSSQVDARVGGDRDLVGRNEKYTVYFANSCSKKVDVTANSHSEVIPPNNCHVFNGGKQYYDTFSYKESGSGERGGQVSCKNVGSSNNDKCNLMGMPENSCVPENTSCVKKTRGSACWVKEKCTKFCDAGQACGNSCISKNDTCSKTPDEGFACNKEDY